MVHLGTDGEGTYISVVEEETGNYNSFNLNDNQVLLLCKQAFNIVIAKGQGEHL